MSLFPFSTLRDLIGDRRGVSAIEFAFVAPILILFYFACVEISLMLTVDRKLTSIASSIGDLVAQDDIISNGEMTDIFAAASVIMQPQDTTGLQMRVTSVVMDGDGDVEVAWSQSQNMSALACGSAVVIPDGVLEPNQSVIMAEVHLDYASPIAHFLTSSYALSDTFYLRPRRTNEVDINPDPC